MCVQAENKLTKRTDGAAKATPAGVALVQTDNSGA